VQSWVDFLFLDISGFNLAGVQPFADRGFTGLYMSISTADIVLNELSIIFTGKRLNICGVLICWSRFESCYIKIAGFA
jgi:hypothetical protein